MESTVKKRPSQEHLLFTVLGMNPRPARYVLGDREVEAQLAPVALLDLMLEKDRPGRVLALCTPEAKRESLPLLEEALCSRLPIEVVSIPSGETQEDVNNFLATVVGAIDPGVELTVDVTHGFRHFSFLTYISLLYLAALRGVSVRAAYYGMLNPEGQSPFLDLRPLLDLPRWIHALEVLQDTGSALPMARNLLDGPGGQQARDNARDLRRLSEAYLSGLPLELGWQARNVLAQRRKPLQSCSASGATACPSPRTWSGDSLTCSSRSPSTSRFPAKGGRDIFGCPSLNWDAKRTSSTICWEEGTTRRHFA